MTDYRILVTGSREWADRKMVFDALDAALAKYAWQGGEDWTITVVHGRHRSGADWFARMWYWSRKRLWFEHVLEDAVPADWKRLGKAAGNARNQVMVDKGAVECLAFFWYGAENRGTGDCAGRAVQAGIPVTYIYGNGPQWTRTSSLTR